MKESKITRTIEEINGYIAIDGTFFALREECEKYEKSAKMVIFNIIKDKMVAKTTEYNLFKIGSDDNDIEIFKIDSIETVELLNRYITLCFYKDIEENLVKEDMVGKTILITWNYDHDWCEVLGDIDDMYANIKQRYTEIVSQE